ncbi:MAG TPA: hypothetical protein VFP60_00435 [Pseudolabrys sp.]|nr:hypothetical protein [Pseudolabrys sp.]
MFEAVVLAAGFVIVLLPRAIFWLPEEKDGGELYKGWMIRGV